jgi:hypothetical protein
MNNGSVIRRGMYTYDSKSSPYTGLVRPLELQEVEAPSISRQYANEGLGDTAGAHICYRLSQPQGHSAAIYDNILLNCS